eukprot:TRINITY_DN5256_c0_g1_i1.p1 TRINITY_DN5256_c0_g1~~TRINITY_DN5256_c0_g1_i1.p1  ORF type:complete len:96 (-),score=15.52 TRINITY_DN5256_c0_g1_i1:13-300(-)
MLYVVRRYGPSISEEHRGKLTEAWKLLLKHVYSATHGGGVTKSLIVKRPAIRLLHSDFIPTNTFYEARVLRRIWNLFVEVAVSEDAPTHSETFHF